MPFKDTSNNRNQLPDVRESLAKAHILIFGASADGQRLASDLYRAGASQIHLLDTSASSLNVDAELLNKITYETMPWMLSTIEEVVKKADIVIDVLSDWQQKLALSDVCTDGEKVLVHSGITGFRFQIYTMIPGRSACLRCALPLAGIDEVPLQPSQEETIDSVRELVVAWQSLETVKYLAKIGIVQGNELFKFDCLSGEFEIIRGLDANPDCPDCGKKIAQRPRRIFLI